MKKKELQAEVYLQQQAAQLLMEQRDEARRKLAQSQSDIRNLLGMVRKDLETSLAVVESLSIDAETLYRH